jgi:hypothetical protein
VKSRGRRVERRAAYRRALKRDRQRRGEMLVPEHIKALVELLSGR